MRDLRKALCSEIPDDHAIAQCRELPGGDDDKLPEWIEILPAGEKIIGHDGRGFRNPDPQAVINASGEQSTDIPVDWEHATERVGFMGGTAPAAGWVTSMELRDGSTWAKVDWTPKGADSVRGREYRYVSPAFLHREGKVERIVSVGLTNRPNLDLKALNHRGHKEPETMEPKLLKALGLAENATTDDAIKAVNSLQANASSPSLDKYVPRADYDAAINRATEAEQTLAQRDTDDRAKAVDASIEQALKSGKITPATADYHRQQCHSEGGLERFEKFVASAPEVGGKSGLDGRTATDDTKALNAQELAVAENCGLTLEEYRAGAN